MWGKVKVVDKTTFLNMLFGNIKVTNKTAVLRRLTCVD
jgi:hypothetical protein